MQSLRRLSVVSIAPLSATLILCAVSVRAQTPAAPSATPAPSNNASPFSAQLPPLFSTGQSSPPLVQMPSTPFRLPPLSLGTSQNRNIVQMQNLALNQGPCYTMRTYGFTTGHDPAAAPRLSTSTTCTPASQTHVKELVNAPASH